MARLSEKQRIEVLIMIGCGDKQRSQHEVCEMFNTKYPNQQISQSTVSRIFHKFEESGTVSDLPKTGRRRTVGENDKQNVMLVATESPNASVRSIGTTLGLAKSSVHRTLRNEKWYPYKVNVVQELLADDTDRRLEFCEIMTNLLQRQPAMKNLILFSDEATFSLHGTVNKQNTRYWSSENPYWVQEGHTQRPQKVNVWAGMIGNQILGPFFFDGTLTADMYLDFLRFDLIPALVVLFPNQDNPDIPSNNIWMQQDGAPPHFRGDVRNYLQDMFPGRWIGRRGPVEWPPRSPDLTPLDFFLWGYLKSKVYVNRPNNIEALKERIREEIRSIPPDDIQHSINEFENRLSHCLIVNGGHFEQLL